MKLDDTGVAEGTNDEDTGTNEDASEGGDDAEAGDAE